MEYPIIKERLDATDEAEGLLREVTVVAVADGIHAEVMAIWGDEDSDVETLEKEGFPSLAYVMYQPCGKLTFVEGSEGELPGKELKDYGFSLSDIVGFVVESYRPSES